MAFDLAIRKTKKKKLVKVDLNIKQEEFARMYATDPVIQGNATHCYMKVYGEKNFQTATVNASKLISQVKITARINDLLSEEGFNDQNVDKQHLFVINQHKDLSVKMKGIEHYNRLRKRIDNKIELILPKPIMELDEDEVIHKIDKSSAKEIDNNGV